MRSDLLLYLCDEAEKNLPEEEFDMLHWFTSRVGCGTAHCMMGFAATLDRFKAEGLKLEIDRCFDGTYEGIICLNNVAGYAAAAELFGISREHAEFLFSPEEYDMFVSKEAVIRRIRNYVKEYHEPRNTQQSDQVSLDPHISCEGSEG